MVYGIYRPWMRRPNTTIINHYNYMNTPNGCGYGTGGCGGGISNKAMAWILGITGGVGLLGGILGGISQNRQARAEAQEQKLLQQEQDTKKQDEATLKNLQKIYNEYEWLQMDGKFMAFDKETDEFIGEGSDFDSCKKAIEKYRNKNANNPTETEEDSEIAQLKQANQGLQNQVEQLQKDLEALKNGNTPGNNGVEPQADKPQPSHGWKQVEGNPQPPTGYSWGAMGEHSYKNGETLDNIVDDILGANADNTSKSAMKESIKQMNPNAFDTNGNLIRAGRLNVPVKTTTANNTTSDKNAKIDAPVTFSIQPLKGNKNTASVTIDGQTYTATIKAIDWKGGKAINYVDDFFKAAISFDDNKITEAIKQDLIKELEKQIKDAGYTNVNLYNNNPEAKVLNFGTPPENTSSIDNTNNTSNTENDGATQSVPNGRVAYVTNNNRFGRDTTTATVTLKGNDGKDYTFTVTVNNKDNAIAQLQGKIKADPNFVGQTINLE